MQPALSLLIVFALALAATGLWLTLAQRLGWFDHPNHRSSHVIPTPKSGGAGFVVVFSFFVLSLYVDRWLTLDQLLLLSAGLILALTGFVDDLHALGIRTRIGLQVAAAIIALVLLDAIPPIVFPWGTLEPAWLRACLLGAGLVWLVNLYNFMDGIDGLAAVEAIFFCLALALLSGMGNAGSVGSSAGSSAAAGTVVTTLSLGLAFAVSGFLYFNLPPARLFMGDLGSNYLGYILGILGGLAMQSESVNVWTILVLLGVFVVDASATLVGRMREGAVWYHAHRSHAYQQAALRVNSHGKVVFAVALINVVWLLPLAWLTTLFGNWGLLLTFIAWLPLFALQRLFKQEPKQPRKDQ